MLKNLLLTLSLLVSFSAFSETIFFECKSSPIEGVHIFDAKGVAIVDDFSNIDGLITIKTLKAGSVDSIQVFEQMKIAGYLRHYEAGKPAKNAFDQLILKVTDPYVKAINIVLDSELPLVSNVLSIDNFLYRSNCYRVQE